MTGAPPRRPNTSARWVRWPGWIATPSSTPPPPVARSDPLVAGLINQRGKNATVAPSVGLLRSTDR